MAQAIATIKVMPTSPDVDLEALEIKMKAAIANFAGEGETKTKVEPIAFGLNAIEIIFVMDEALGGPDQLADKINEFEEVNSAEIIDVRRAIG
jgi:elongation factor 1-beta